jgi:hypothetical protein
VGWCGSTAGRSPGSARRGCRDDHRTCARSTRASSVPRAQNCARSGIAARLVALDWRIGCPIRRASLQVGGRLLTVSVSEARSWRVGHLAARRPATSHLSGGCPSSRAAPILLRADARGPRVCATRMTSPVLRRKGERYVRVAQRGTSPDADRAGGRCEPTVRGVREVAPAVRCPEGRCQGGCDEADTGDVDAHPRDSQRCRIGAYGRLNRAGDP